jgi:hypothetical protein
MKAMSADNQRHREMKAMSVGNQRRAAPREEWEQEMVRAISNSLIRDIVADSRRGPAAPSSLASPAQSEKPRPPSGGTAEIKSPPGIDTIDRMCAEQDRAAKAAAVRQRIENEWIEGLLERRDPNRVKFEYDPYSRSRMGFSDDDE